MVEYPNVRISLAGEDGNAFAILGRATRAMRRAGVPDSEIEAYRVEATSANYDHLLMTTMRWVQCDPVGSDLDNRCSECGELLDDHEDDDCADLCGYCGESHYDCEC